MNTLTFFEDHRNIAVTRGVRAVQAATMKHLLVSFQHTPKSRGSTGKFNNICRYNIFALKVNSD